MDHNLWFTERRFCTDIYLRRFLHFHKIPKSLVSVSPHCFSSLVPIFLLFPPCLRAQEYRMAEPSPGATQDPTFLPLTKHWSSGPMSPPWVPGPARWAPKGTIMGGRSWPHFMVRTIKEGGFRLLLRLFGFWGGFCVVSLKFTIPSEFFLDMSKSCSGRSICYLSENC